MCDHCYLCDDVVQLPMRWVFESFKPSSMLLELNDHGDIVRALMDLDAEKVRWPSEVADDAGTLYVGSFCEPYLVRIRLDRLRSVAE